MSHWPTVTLDRCIASIRAGVSLGGQDRIPRHGEMGILTLGAVSSGQFLPQACKTISPSDNAALGECVRAGTLLMSRSNTIDLVGSTVLVEEDHPNRFLPDLLWEIRLRNDSPVSAVFLVDFLATNAGRRLLQSAAMGTSESMKKLSMQRLRRLEVPVPSLVVQTRWAMIRTRLNALQTRHQLLLAAKMKRKRMLTQRLLTGRQRFPEFQGGASWQNEPLSRFLKGKSVRNTGKSVSLVLSCSKVYGIIPQSKRFAKRLASESVAHYKVVSPGDLVYDPMLLWDASIGFVRGNENGIVSPAYATFTFLSDESDRSFLAHALFSYEARHRYKVISRGTNVRRKKAMPEDFLAIRAPIPVTKEERRRVGQLFNMLDREIVLLERQRDAYDRQKRAIMQRLLSGDIPNLGPTA